MPRFVLVRDNPVIVVDHEISNRNAVKIVRDNCQGPTNVVVELRKNKVGQRAAGVLVSTLHRLTWRTSHLMFRFFVNAN